MPSPPSGAAAGVAGAGDRPAAAGRDRADLRGADAGHRGGAVLLDLLEPAAGDAADAGLWVAGHFNADLRNFENVVDVRGRRLDRAALYYVLPNLAPFDVKAEVVHGLPVACATSGSRCCTPRSTPACC